MPKNKGKSSCWMSHGVIKVISSLVLIAGKGGKNYKKGKKRDEGETRRDLLYKEDGQGICQTSSFARGDVDDDSNR